MEGKNSKEKIRNSRETSKRKHRKVKFGGSQSDAPRTILRLSGFTLRISRRWAYR
jgi:hypothetical protein